MRLLNVTKTADLEPEKTDGEIKSVLRIMGIRKIGNSLVNSGLEKGINTNIYAEQFAKHKRFAKFV